jgi:hypothetical protein
MVEAVPQKHGRSVTRIVLALCAVVFLLHAATVRPGHSWWGMDDFTAYLAHGRNLLEGEPYGEIDTVFDPALPPSFQRTAFPPGFSLLVGFMVRPADSISRTGDVLGDDPDRPYGLGILSMKRLLAFFTALSIFLSYRAFRPTSGPAELLLAMAAFGLSPYVFAAREIIRSEMLFLCLAYLWMAQIQWMERREQEGNQTFGVAVLAGVIMAGAYATRAAAVVLPLALIALDVVRQRRLRASTWVVLIVAGACIFGQRAAFHSAEGGYVEKLAREWSLSTITVNLAQLGWNYERLWANGFSTGLQRGVAGFMGILAAVGFLSRLRRPTIVEFFSVLYVMMIVVLPTDSAWMRYLLPVLPVILLSIFRGAKILAGAMSLGVGPVMGSVVLLMLVSYGGAYAHLDYGSLPDGLGDPDAVEVFDWVADNTAPDDVVIFKKSRTMTLGTGRPSISYPEIFKYGTLSDSELWRHFGKVKSVAFVMKHSPARPSNIFRMMNHSDEAFIERFVKRYPDELVEVLRNDNFTVYEVRGFPRER